MYSYSMLNLYKLCPFKFWKKYICNEQEPVSDAMTQGKIFHDLVVNYSDLFEDQYDPEILRAIKALRESEEYKELDIMQSEAKIRKEIDGHNFFSIIDCVAKLPDGQEVIIDWKYTKTSWDEKKEEQYALQKTLYKKITGIDNFWFVNITKHKKTRVEFIKDAKELEWQEVLDIIKKLNSDFHFQPENYKKSTKSACWFCDWRKNDCEAYY